ncbi:hypothetical protein [Amycolatopsis sp. PS_44_ISF1]|uniref:hypothetical protein n=1 Tax=Amycolatopsis sp. PS_44_ISF1 TaxID=2974917 RepID=UPI0028DFCEF3|nr:hypothetical protein [Amycolatopsis sp. PS_44_ISF1]MDT8911800.1 hypothetical protein [Amycolatopsis sp. PS_44_ISF1]
MLGGSEEFFPDHAGGIARPSREVHRWSVQVEFCAVAEPEDPVDRWDVAGRPAADGDRQVGRPHGPQ